MKSNSILILSLALLFLTNCHKDNFDPGIVISHPNNVETHIVKGVSGRIQDIMGEAIIPDKLSYDNNTMSVDEESFFNFKASINTNSLQIYSIKKAYYDAIFSEPMPQKGYDYIELIHVPLEVVLDYSSAQAIHYVNESVEVDVPADAFADAKGVPYKGTVHFTAKVIDPDDQINYQFFPFLARVKKTDNSYYRLKQLNGVIIEAYDDKGDKLRLLKLASVKIPISKALQGNSPACKAWYYDTATMQWIVSGECSFSQNVYQFETANLGCNSIAIPYLPFEAEGKFNAQNIGAVRSIKVLEKSLNLVTIVRPNLDLYYHSFIPSQDQVEFSIKDNCDQLLFKTKSSLGNPFAISDPKIHIIKGTIVDCNDKFISNGYAVVKDENGSSFKVIKADNAGNFNTTIDLCGLDQVQIYGANQSSGIKGSSYYFENANTINIGNLKVCEVAPTINKVTIQVDDQIRIVEGNAITIKKDANFNILHVQFTDKSLLNGTVNYTFDLNQTGVVQKFDLSGFNYSQVTGNPESILVNVMCPNIKVQRWGINEGQAIELTIRNCKIVLFPETDTQGKHKGTIRLEGKIEV